MPRKITKTKKIKTRKKTIPTIDLYRKVVISFVVLTTILILIILYFSFVSVTIIITPQPEKVIANFTVEVVEAEDGLVPDQINGIFFNQEVTGEREFLATGSKIIASDVVGRMIIYNNYRRPQPLVATTRLLSPDNILLRIKNRVDVPVGGSVEVDVYIDNPEQLKDRVLLAETHFIIPGLWPQLQDKIYAESLTPIKIGENKVKVVTAEDIEGGQQVLLEQLKAQALEDFGAGGNVAKALEIKVDEISINVKAGEARKKFIIKIKAVIEGILFDKKSIIDLADSRMRGSLPKDKKLLEVNYQSLNYSIEKKDLDGKTAEVRVYLEGVSVIRLSSDILDKNKLKGLTRDEVKSYFAAQPLVKSVKINFFPFWVKKIPQLNDHIEVMIK